MDMNPKAKYQNMTRAETCRMLQVTESAMTNFLREGIPFKEDEKGKKTFDSRDVIDFVVIRGGLDLRGPKTSVQKTLELNKKNRAKSLNEDDEDDLEPEIFSDQLERSRKLKGDLYEFELSKKRGEVIDRELHDQFVVQAGEFCRSSFQAIPRKIAMSVAKENDSSVIEKIIEKEIVAILKDLSEKKI